MVPPTQLLRLCGNNRDNYHRRPSKFRRRWYLHIIPKTPDEAFPSLNYIKGERIYRPTHLHLTSDRRRQI